MSAPAENRVPLHSSSTKAWNRGGLPPHTGSRKVRSKRGPDPTVGLGSKPAARALHHLQHVPSPQPCPHPFPFSPAGPRVRFSVQPLQEEASHGSAKQASSIQRVQPCFEAGGPGTHTRVAGVARPCSDPAWQGKSSSPGTATSWGVPPSLTAPQGCTGPVRQEAHPTSPLHPLPSCRAPTGSSHHSRPSPWEP